MLYGLLVLEGGEKRLPRTVSCYRREIDLHTEVGMRIVVEAVVVQLNWPCALPLLGIYEYMCV